MFLFNNPGWGKFQSLLLGCLLAACLIFWWGDEAKAQEAGKKKPMSDAPIRLGIIHPYPLLCIGQEQSQRDLRVLRLGFGLGGSPRERREVPWFYSRLPLNPFPPYGILLMLDTQALWGISGPGLLELESGNTDSLPTGPLSDPLSDPLLEWRKAINALAPGLKGTAPFPTDRLSLDRKPEDPFWLSRFGGSSLLPYRKFESVANAGFPCAVWPLGITLEEGDNKIRYRLRGKVPAAQAVPFLLTAYRTPKGLWSALKRGRLDVALLEGGELDKELKKIIQKFKRWGDSPPDWLLGIQQGTQQIVVRVKKPLRDKLGAEGMMALSRALNRRSLAKTAGLGFSRVKNFLSPLFSPPTINRKNPLRWGSRSARGYWLKEERLRGNLEIVVLDDPVLLNLARLVSAQWEKTLNLLVTVKSYHISNFGLAAAADSTSFVLDVADLDNGSLQEVWNQALALTGIPLELIPPETDLTPLEEKLQSVIPYLPLVENRHFFLAPHPKNSESLQTICPDCTTRPLKVFLKEL